MGKWATYRKRARPNTALVLPAPPPPSLDQDSGDLFSDPETDDNVGGTLTLQREFPPGTWVLIDFKPFATPAVVWGLLINFAPGDYRAFQTGNGADFAGTSEPSATFTI